MLCLLMALGILSPVDSSTVLPDVVVTANRAEADAFETPATVHVLKNGQIENRLSRTSPEALQAMGGVFLQKTNHGGGSPFLRGLTGNQTLLIIDGVRLNNSTFRYGPNQYFNTINPFNISRVEALAGSGSTLYGSDALGGTIQVITRTPQLNSGFQLKASERIGLPGQEISSILESGFSQQNWGIAINGAFRKFGDLKGGRNTGFQRPSGYDEAMLDAKAVFKIQDGLITVANQFYRAADVPVYHKITLEDYLLHQFSPQKRNLSYLKLEKSTGRKLVNSWQISGSFHQTEEGRQNIKAENPSIENNENDRVKTFGFNALFRSKASGWRATSGVDFYHDRVNSERHVLDHDTNFFQPKRGLYPDNSSSVSAAVYTLHSFYSNGWQLTGGLRYTLNRVTITEEALGKVSLSPNAFTPSLAVSRFVGENLHFYLSYNRGFRSPNIDDMGTLGIVDFRYEVPAYELKPERSDAFELGTKYRNEKLILEAAVFNTQLSALITREKLGDQMIDDYPVYVKKNTQSASIRGFEFNAQLFLNPYSHLSGELIYAFGQSLSKNEPLRRIPPLFGRLTYQLEKQKFFFLPEFFFAGAQKRLSGGDMDDNRINPEGTPGWAIVNLHSGYAFGELSLKATLQNLMNSDYRMHGSGINGPGRILSIQLTYSLK